MNPAATQTKPAEAGSRPCQPASAGFVLLAVGFSPPAYQAAAERERHTPLGAPVWPFATPVLYSDAEAAVALPVRNVY